jgi:FlaA1/EpsC-like NDP-sugar epimerase
MLREQKSAINQLHRLLDILLTIAAFVFAYYIKIYLLPSPFRGLIQTSNYYVVSLLIVIIWPISFRYFGIYGSYRFQSLKKIILKVLKSLFFGVIVLSFVMYLLKIDDVSRIMMCIFITTNILFLVASKIIIFKILQNMRRKGYNFQNILIVGGRERAKEVIHAIKLHAGSGYRILGCLGIAGDEIGSRVKGDVAYIGAIDQLDRILLDQVVDQIIFALPLKLVDDIEAHIKIAEEFGVSVRILPDWNLHKLKYSPGIARLRIEPFLDIPTMCLQTTPTVSDELQLKAIMDLFGAVTLIILFFPVFLSIAALIKLFSKGPVLFAQERCGLNGRRFNMYKFRTMVYDAEKKTSPARYPERSGRPGL